MRVYLLLMLFLSGCSHPDGHEFDSLLASNHIDRIEIVDDEHGRTNVLTEGAAARLLSRLAATNRTADPVRGKSYISGYVWLCNGSHPSTGSRIFLVNKSCRIGATSSV